MTMSLMMAWASEHLAVLWPILSALLVLVLRSRTPEDWVALGERSPRLQGVIRLVRALGLDPVKAVSALVQIVTARAPAPPAAPTAAPPAAPREGQSGGARLDLIALAFATAVVCLALGVVLYGCPRLPPVSGCAPTAQRCADGRPEVCSGSQRWEPVGDLACGQVGGLCVVSDAGVAHCVRATDGGAP